MTPRKRKPRPAWTTKVNEATDPAHWRALILTRCVVSETGCWVWQNALNSTGYGKLHPRRDITVNAHRASYLAFVGPVEPGIVIDHLCRLPACVNPAHLEAVTTQENSERGYMRPVAYSYSRGLTHCRNGHEYTPENVRWRTNYDGHRVRNCITCERARWRERARERRALLRVS